MAKATRRDLCKRGKLSAKKLVAMAADDATGADADRLRRVSASRNSASTVYRELRPACRLPPTYTRDIWMHDAVKNEATLQPISILPIHEMVHTVLDESWLDFLPDQYDTRRNLSDFGKEHGIDTSVGLWALLGIWGDSAPLSKRDSLYLVTFRVMNGRHRRRIWVAGLRKSKLCQCGCFGRHTFNEIFLMIAWSFQALLCGRFPAKDHAGCSFVSKKDQWRLDMLKVKLLCKAFLDDLFGDWQFHKQVVGVRDWTGHGTDGKMRWLCDGGLYGSCIDGSHDCYDTSIDASWRPTQDDKEVWSRLDSLTNISKIW